MKKSISIVFSFDFAVRLSSFNLFDIGSDKEYLDVRKSVEDFSNEYHSTFKKQLDSIVEFCNNGHSISIYLSTDFIQLLEQVDPQAIELLRGALSSGNLELLGGLDRPNLSSIYSEKQFRRSIASHRTTIKSIFGFEPTIFYNFENIFFAEMGSILSENKFKATFAGAIDWYLGSNLNQRIFHLHENEKFSILLVDKDQTKSLFQIDEIQHHFLHFNSSQITGLEGVNSIISTTGSRGQIVPLKKQITANKVTNSYNIKNPVMGSTKHLMLDSFNGNALQSQILKQYYQLEEMVEATNDDKALALWDKIGNALYLHMINVMEINATKPYAIYNQLNNILTDMKLKLEGY